MFVVVVAVARSGQIENYLMVQWLPLSDVAETEATVKRAPSAGQAEQMRKLPASKFIEVYRLGPSPGLIVDICMYKHHLVNRYNVLSTT